MYRSRRLPASRDMAVAFECQRYSGSHGIPQGVRTTTCQDACQAFLVSANCLQGFVVLCFTRVVACDISLNHDRQSNETYCDTTLLTSNLSVQISPQHSNHSRHPLANPPPNGPAQPSRSLVPIQQQRSTCSTSPELGRKAQDPPARCSSYPKSDTSTCRPCVFRYPQQQC
jgi:hypothetical protein